MIGIGDNANRSSGFTLKRPLDVRIYALGESSDQEMVDYAWIVNALDHKRVWTMRYENTEPAGGSDKISQACSANADCFDAGVCDVGGTNACTAGD